MCKCSFKHCPSRKKLIYPDEGIIFHDGHTYHLECWKAKRELKRHHDLLPLQAGALA